MILVWQFCAVLIVTVVNCQSHVWFKINGQERALFSNSYIYYANIIGNGYNALKCVIDNPNCCTDVNWNDETGTRGVGRIFEGGFPQAPVRSHAHRVEGVAVYLRMRATFTRADSIVVDIGVC